MPPMGGFLSALGGAFRGHAEDRQFKADQTRTSALDAQNVQRYDAEQARNSRLDAQNAELHGAQMGNYRSETAMRDARTQQEATMRTPEFQDAYVKARGGDTRAQAYVVSVVAGHPNESSIVAPFNQHDRINYDSARGGYFDQDSRTFTALDGLPKRTTSSDDLAAERLRLSEAASARAERQQRLSAAKSNLDETRRDVPRPSKVQAQIIGPDPKDPRRQTMIENPERGRITADSMKYEREQLDPARTRYTDALSMFDTGGGGGAPPKKKPLSAADLARATADGKRDQFLAWARVNGYNVP